MDEIKKNLRIVFGVFFVLFFGLVVYLGYFWWDRSEVLANSSLNPRVRLAPSGIRRGDILDRHGVVLAHSVADETGGFQRIYPYGRAFAHVVGYTGMSHAGIEERYNIRLSNLSWEMYQRLRGIALEGEVLQGDGLQLTLDAALQNYIYQRLGTHTGSVVVLEPTTGKVRAMVSNPTFDPNTVAQDWQGLIQDTGGRPLINRSAQGLYPPGSTFKILTAAAAIDQGLEAFVYEDTGSITLEGHTIRNFNSVPHGTLDLTEAFARSSNTYFVALADEMGVETYVAQVSNMFRQADFVLANNTSQFNLTADAPLADLMQTAMGQGQTLVTPLFMANLVGAIAGEGYLMRPQLVYQVLDHRGEGRVIFQPQREGRLFSNDQVVVLKELMTEVVRSGTGQNAALANGIQLAGKTGTAENEAGDSHGWFVGFAPAENPQYVIVVMLEHSGGTGPVLPMVRDILNFAFTTSY